MVAKQLVALIALNSVLACGFEPPPQSIGQAEDEVIEFTGPNSILYVGFGPRGPFWWAQPVGLANPTIHVQVGLPTAAAMTAAGTTEYAVLAAVETAELAFGAAGGTLTGTGGAIGVSGTTGGVATTGGSAGGSTLLGTVAIGTAIIAIAVVATVGIDYGVHGNFFWEPVIAAYDSAPQPKAGDPLAIHIGWRCWATSSIWSFSSFKTQCLACCDATFRPETSIVAVSAMNPLAPPAPPVAPPLVVAPLVPATTGEREACRAICNVNAS